MKNSKKFIRTAIVYIRNSMKEKKNIYSLDEQEKAISDFASEWGYRILEVFREENASGKTFDRSAFREMVRYIKANRWKIKFLIVTDLWRLSTDRNELERFKRFSRSNGIEVVSIIQLMLKYTGKRSKYLP